MIKVYIAGRIAEDELLKAYGIRQEIIDELIAHRLIPVDPMSMLVEYNPLLRKVIRKPEVDDKYIFDQDIALLKDCDAVLVYLDGIIDGTGTPFELGYAHATGKPIVAYGQPNFHPFIKCPIQARFNLLMDAAAYLAKL
jgi:nucleoside 2-deoxyribosyltransferase